MVPTVHSPWTRSSRPTSTVREISFASREPQSTSSSSYYQRSPHAERASKFMSDHRPRSPPLIRGPTRFGPSHPSPTTLARRVSLDSALRPARSVSPLSNMERVGYGHYDHRSSWNPSVKRRLSPEIGHRRSASPPAKKYITNHGQAEARTRFGSPFSLKGVPTHPKGDHHLKRSFHPSFRPERSHSPKSVSRVVSREPSISSSTAITSGGPSGTPASGVTARNPQTLTLNRELWDLRRQITALKAQEDHVLEELKRIRAPEMAENTIVPKTQTAEERLKILEAEVVCTCILRLLYNKTRVGIVGAVAYYASQWVWCFSLCLGLY